MISKCITGCPMELLPSGIGSLTSAAYPDGGWIPPHGSRSCSRRRNAATKARTRASSSATARSCTPTATGCSGRCTTPRTRSRTRCCARGAGCPRFEARSSLRSWLYRIATNASLDLIARRPKRVLPGRPRPGRGSPRQPRPAHATAGRDGVDGALPGRAAGPRGRIRRARGALRAARERRAGVRRGAAAPAAQPARRADPARGARLLRAARSRSRWTRRPRR